MENKRQNERNREEKRILKYNGGRPGYLLDHKIYDINKWTKVLAGHPAFIIGNGPSLFDHDVELLENSFTIGTNQAFKKIEPTMIFWQDVECWNDNWEEISKLKSIKVSRDRSDPQNVCVKYKVIKSPSYTFLPTVPWIIPGHGGTGKIAIKFAYALGCSPILLIGMDFKYSKGKTDFYGVNKHHSERTLSIYQKDLNWIKKNAKDLNIFSCNEDSDFPYISFDDMVRIFSYSSLGMEGYKSILRMSKFDSKGN